MSQPALLMLAQDTAAPTKPWWQVLLENGLALTLLLIFLVAIIGVIFRLRRKDKCLKLLAGDHVSYLTTAGLAVWGDLTVYSQGLELRFDAPHNTPHGLTRSGALIYESELATCLALCRVDGALTDEERRRRQRQIRRSFRPGLLRRIMRSIRNMLNTLRDAFSKAINTLLGALSRARPGSTVLTTHQGEVGEIGQTLLGAAANAYEPLLEAHIGKPVLLRIASPTSPTDQPIELPGYLVDYTERFIAVFNVDHEPAETFELEVEDSVDQPHVRVQLHDDAAIVTCTGPEPIVVAQAGAGEQSRDVASPLLPGCSMSLPRTSDEPLKLSLQRTRRLDVVCPRAVATVQFAAETETPSRRGWLGLAPWYGEEATEATEATEAVKRDGEG